MTWMVDRKLPAMTINRYQFEELVDYIQRGVKSADKPDAIIAYLTISINGLHFSDVKSFLDHWNHRALSTQDLSFSGLQIGASKFVKKTSAYTYVTVTWYSKRTELYVYGNDSVSSRETKALADLLVTTFSKYHRPQLPLSAKIAGGSTACLMFLGGIIGSVAISPEMLVCLPLAAIFGTTTLIANTHMSKNQLALERAPSRRPDLAVNVARS